MENETFVANLGLLTQNYVSAIRERVWDGVILREDIELLLRHVEELLKELHDFGMVIDHCGTIYSHFTEGRISKPTTLPENVITIAEDIQNERWREWLKEELETRGVKEQ